jgi:hypothetical protein
MKDAAKTTIMRVTLPRAVAEALAAVSGARSAELAAWIVSQWIGRLPSPRLAPAKTAIAEQRLAILRRWWKFREDVKRSEAQATGAFVRRLELEGLTVSRSALYEWQRRWEAKGLEGLIDRRGPRDAKPLQTAFYDRVRELYMAPRGSSLLSAYRTAADEVGPRRPVPSYGTVWRRMRHTAPQRVSSGQRRAV